MKKTIVLPIIGLLWITLIGAYLYISNLETKLETAEDKVWEAQNVSIELILEYLPEEEWIEVKGHRYLQDPSGGYYYISTLIDWDESGTWSGDDWTIIWSQVVDRFCMLRQKQAAVGFQYGFRPASLYPSIPQQ